MDSRILLDEKYADKIFEILSVDNRTIKITWIEF